MMYCANCGVQLSEALSYCNRCGARLSKPAHVDTTRYLEHAKDNLIWAIVGTTITLLGMSLGALVLIKNRAIGEPLGNVFVLLSFVAFILVEGLLIWRLMNLSKGTQTPQQKRPDDFRTEGLGADSVAELPPSPDSIGSVTEQTTRSFEHSYRTGE
jgi:hypothetical protein